MTRQAEVFRHSEGAAWFRRNVTKLTGEDDPVLDCIATQNLRPRSVLEVGCANGWRLKILQRKYGCNICGVEPSPMDHPAVIRGTADNLPIKKLRFDLVIFGWCLYLCDREDLFKIAAEADRVLSENGHLIVYDFYPEQPHKNKYKHYSGLYSYKQDYSKLWLGNPAYSAVGQFVYGNVKDDDTTAVIVLKKSTEQGWPAHV